MSASATFTNDPAAGVMITLIKADGGVEGPALHTAGADATTGTVDFSTGQFKVDSTKIAEGSLTLTGPDEMQIIATLAAPPAEVTPPPAVGGRRRRRGKKMSKKMMKHGGRRSRRSKGTAKAAKMLKSMSKSLRMMSKI